VKDEHTFGKKMGINGRITVIYESVSSKLVLHFEKLIFLRRIQIPGIAAWRSSICNISSSSSSE
jgi:hypothetical protein